MGMYSQFGIEWCGLLYECVYVLTSEHSNRRQLLVLVQHEGQDETRMAIEDAESSSDNLPKSQSSPTPTAT